MTITKKHHDLKKHAYKKSLMINIVTKYQNGLQMILTEIDFFYLLSSYYFNLKLLYQTKCLNHKILQNSIL